jgi:cytoskeleton protein RodZ
MTRQKELIPMMPGDILRHEREKKGLTLEKAAAQSRIKPSVLKAIESGETDEIPNVYLRGHIQHYARYLGVNPATLDQHMEHVSGAEPEVRSVFEFNTTRADADKWLKATSYLVASALIATLAWQFTHEAVRFSQSRSGLTSAAAGTESPAVAEMNNAASPRSSNKHLNASIASMELLNLPQDGQASTGNMQSAFVADGAQYLKINTSADTWVEVLDADGQHMEMDLLRAGTSREYIGKPPYRVLLGRASAVEVWLNGQAVNLAPHTRGNVARVTLGNQSTARAGQQEESVKR